MPGVVSALRTRGRVFPTRTRAYPLPNVEFARVKICFPGTNIDVAQGGGWTNVEFARVKIVFL